MDVVAIMSLLHGCLDINDHIDPEAVTLSYTTVDDTIRIANTLGHGIFLAKIRSKMTMPC